MSTAATGVDTTAAPATATSSTTITPTSAVTTLIRGRTINDETGEEEEFTIETIPLNQLTKIDSDKLAVLASKVLKYFDDEAAEEAAATEAGKQ